MKLKLDCNVMKLLGINFLMNNNIRSLYVDEFDDLNNNEKIKYIIYYFLRVEKCLKLIINLYDLLIIYDNKLKQIITPKPVNINFNRVYSETDSDDIHLLTQY